MGLDSIFGVIGKALGGGSKPKTPAQPWYVKNAPILIGGTAAFVLVLVIVTRK